MALVFGLILFQELKAAAESTQIEDALAAAEADIAARVVEVEESIRLDTTALEQLYDLACTAMQLNCVCVLGNLKCQNLKQHTNAAHRR